MLIYSGISKTGKQAVPQTIQEVLYMEVGRLKALLELGQSPWYDNIDRRIIQNGKMAEIFRQGVTGVTSNPSIFEKAVTSSTIYDFAIKQLAAHGMSPEDITEEITNQDIRSAADLLKKTYEETDGQDGYVSLEVSPEYAYDVQKTTEHARKINRAVARPNLMIKIPGTTEGCDALRILTKEGININATLLFSVKHYEAIAEAYIQGLRERQNLGGPLDRICSVASVFVSRIDTKVDAALMGPEGEGLRGRIAVANIKEIYQRYKETFFDGPFRELAAKGGRVQRVLWGSTSTKDPLYSDVKYVDEIIGKGTINTLPHNTLEAFMDHGTPRLTIEEDLDRARADLKFLKGHGIDLDEVCEQIQHEGVKAFQASYVKLIEAVAEKAGLGGV